MLFYGRMPQLAAVFQKMTKKREKKRVGVRRTWSVGLVNSKPTGIRHKAKGLRKFFCFVFFQKKIFINHKMMTCSAFL